MLPFNVSFQHISVFVQRFRHCKRCWWLWCHWTRHVPGICSFLTIFSNHNKERSLIESNLSFCHEDPHLPYFPSVHVMFFRGLFFSNLYLRVWLPNTGDFTPFFSVPCLSSLGRNIKIVKNAFGWWEEGLDECIMDFKCSHQLHTHQLFERLRTFQPNTVCCSAISEGTCKICWCQFDCKFFHWLNHSPLQSHLPMHSHYLPVISVRTLALNQQWKHTFFSAFTVKYQNISIIFTSGQVNLPLKLLANKTPEWRRN